MAEKGETSRAGELRGQAENNPTVGNFVGDVGNNQPSFTLPQLRTMTTNFSSRECISEQKTADLFKGNIVIDQENKMFVVKRLKKRFGRSWGTEFDVEVHMLSRLSHPNIVTLVGNFSDTKERIIIYENMSGTLYHQLHALATKKEALGWHTRMRIAAGVARGLIYLHEGADPPVILGNLNPKGVLLTEDLQPKIADFGIVNKPSDRMLIPLTFKSDVYVFGVLLVEIITSKKPKDKTRGKSKYLGDWILKSKGIGNIADPKMNGEIPELLLRRALIVALACLREDAGSRPAMGTVLQAMEYLSPDRDVESSWPIEFDAMNAEMILSSDVPLAADYSANDRMFCLQDIKTATISFSSEGLIRQCAFGDVYKGRLEGKNVDFKRQWPLENKASRCYAVESKVLALVNHDNIVKLFGYCLDGNEHIIVQEHMPVGTLFDRLHDLKIGQQALDWNSRMKIAVGVAKGLCYLHEEANPMVIHGNLTSSTVLLEVDLNPKITEFGHSVYGPDYDMKLKHKTITNPGYSAPEDTLTAHADVYSYGVLLLEIITGKSGLNGVADDTNRPLLRTVSKSVRAGIDFVELADSHLNRLVPVDIMKAIITIVVPKCTQEDPNLRPKMVEVLNCMLYLTSRPYDPSEPRQLRLLLAEEVRSDLNAV